MLEAVGTIEFTPQITRVSGLRRMIDGGLIARLMHHVALHAVGRCSLTRHFSDQLLDALTGGFIRHPDTAGQLCSFRNHIGCTAGIELGKTDHGIGLG